MYLALGLCTMYSITLGRKTRKQDIRITCFLFGLDMVENCGSVPFQVSTQLSGVVYSSTFSSEVVYLEEL